MMKITKTAFALLISASMVLAGCQSADNGTVSDKASSSDTSESDNLADTSVSDTSASDTSASETSQSDSANGDTENSEDNTSKAQLPASEEDLYAFMEGEWDFFNTDTMNDYGHIVISADGSFDYGYIGEEETCTGDFKANHLYEAEENVPLTLTISVSGIDNISFDEDLVYVPEDGTADSNVKIYYGSCDGEDYVFFEETGNGDTFIGNYLFQDPETFDGSYPMFAASCVMHRASNESEGDSITSDSFYAWVWKADEGGIWAQEMKPLTWDAEDEYTLNRYNAAAFTPSDLSSVYYEYTDSVDKRVLLNGQRLDMECPRYMCRVTVNDEGMIENLEEVDATYYGIYVLGEIEAEISYDGMIFTYNGVDFDLSEEGASTAIMNVYSAYGKEIVECHVNPDITGSNGECPEVHGCTSIPSTNEYFIFNKYLGEFAYDPIVGTNLIWLNDDFTTAIYANGNEVRDLCGDLMFNVEGGEIYSLEFTDDGNSVICSYYINGSDETKEETFEMPERRDIAMNAFSDYTSSQTASDYRRFMEYAPTDAAFFVITDPQDWVLSYYCAIPLEEGAENIVIIVSLYDDTDFEIYESNNNLIEEITLNRGRSSAYLMTVSETMALYNVNASTTIDGQTVKASWPVATFSGETYQHSQFITY